MLWCGEGNRLGRRIGTSLFKGDFLIERSSFDPGGEVFSLEGAFFAPWLFLEVKMKVVR